MWDYHAALGGALLFAHEAPCPCRESSAHGRLLVAAVSQAATARSESSHIITQVFALLEVRRRQQRHACLHGSIVVSNLLGSRLPTDYVSTKPLLCVKGLTTQQPQRRSCIRALIAGISVDGSSPSMSLAGRAALELYQNAN